MAGKGGGPAGGRCQPSRLSQHPDYELPSGRALLSHTHSLSEWKLLALLSVETEAWERKGWIQAI